MTVMKSTLVLLLALLALVAAGCNSAQAGAGVGAGVGALAGQAIGGNTSSTLIGAGAGAAINFSLQTEPVSGTPGTKTVAPAISLHPQTQLKLQRY